MQPERIEKVKYLVSAALGRSPHERDAYLTAVCGGDASLRREVEYYLNNSEKTEEFHFGAETTRLTDDFANAATVAFSGGIPTDPRIGKIFGKYIIQKRLAEGGMGIVYGALDTHLGREVALKVLPEFFSRDNERLQRFQREARAISLLNHPNIVTIFEIGNLDGCEFIVTEYVEGETLREKMTGATIPFVEMLKITAQVASALSAAHKAGIVHRDTKPENVMLRPDGYVKVLDFGLAKLTEATRRSISGDAPVSQRSFNRTMPGAIMGTAAYMSPEQAEGGEVDARTDIWGLGVLLYEMVAGKLPFEGPTDSHTIVAILEQAPEPIRHAPPELQQIIATALQKNKALRYQTADAMTAALDGLKHKLGYVSDQYITASSVQPLIQEPPITLEQPIKGEQSVTFDQATRGEQPVTLEEAITPEQPGNAVATVRPSPYRKLLWLVPAAFVVLLIFAAGMYALMVWLSDASRAPVSRPSVVNSAQASPEATLAPTPAVVTPTPAPVYVDPTPEPTKDDRPVRTQPSPEPTHERQRPVPTPSRTAKPVEVKKTPRSTPKPKQDPNCVFTNSCH